MLIAAHRSLVAASAGAAAVCALLADELEVALERECPLREQCRPLPLTQHRPRAGADANPNEHTNHPARTLTSEHSSTHALISVQVQRAHATHSCTHECTRARAGVDVLHGHGRGTGARHRPASQRSSAAMPSDADRSGSHVRVGACDAFLRHSSTASRSLSHATSDDRRLLARMLCRLMSDAE